MKKGYYFVAKYVKNGITRNVQVHKRRLKAILISSVLEIL